MGLPEPLLLVDADPASRRAAADALVAAGHEVIACASLGDAAGHLPVRLVVLDASAGGASAMAELRSTPNGAGTPVVLMGAFDAPGAAAQAFAAGADDVVSQPVHPSELVARVERQLRLHSVERARAARAHETETLLELTQALASSLDLRDILFTVVRRVADMARVDRCSIVLVRGEEEVGWVVAASDDEHVRELPLDLGKYPEIRQVTASGEPLVVEDATTHPLLEVVRAELPPGGFTSLALVPIRLGDKSLGVFFLRARQPVAFAPEQLAVYRAIASATAVAVHHARLLESLRRETHASAFARFEAERKIASLQRYADYFQSAAEGIAVVDADARLLFANPSARAITGYDETDLAAHTVIDLIPPDAGGAASELMRAFVGAQFTKTLLVPLVRKDGARIVLSVNLSPLLRGQNAALLTFRDVTAERATEIELRKTKEFLERVIDQSIDAIVSADTHGRVLLFNRAAERCYGYRADEVVGRLNVAELYPAGEARRVMSMIRSGERGGPGRLEDFRCEVLGKGEERIPVALSASLLVDGGVAVGSVGIFSDLRERLRMEQRLEAAHHELEWRERQAIVAELAGAAAHELNQPLTSVTGYASLLKRRLEPGSPASDAADVIFQEATRMADIVRKIGKITRYETKSYVGAAKILDLDRASADATDAPPTERGLPDTDEPR